MTLLILKLIYLFVVTVLAYSVRGGTGFGAAIAMPFMAFVVPMKILVPAWSVLSGIAGLPIVWRESENIAWGDLVPLIWPCMLGVAFGLFFYDVFDSPTLARGMAICVVLYGIWSLRDANRSGYRWRISRNTIAKLSGLIGGAIGTTFGALTSLSFAVYFDAIRMPKDQFIATMAAALVGMGFVRSLGYYALGQFTAEVWLLLAITIPMTLFGMYIGDRVFADISETAFRRFVSLTLMISGFVLLVK
jgi:uncharacterized membrane protein YfcA